MSKFLIVKIANGFGNQMFLYAAAYAFAKKMGYKILIDNETGINHDIHKSKKVKRANWKPKYELDIFTLTSDIAENKYKFISKKINKFTNKIKIGISWRSKNETYGMDKSIDLNLFKTIVI